MTDKLQFSRCLIHQDYLAVYVTDTIMVAYVRQFGKRFIKVLDTEKPHGKQVLQRIEVPEKYRASEFLDFVNRIKTQMG